MNKNTFALIEVVRSSCNPSNPGPSTYPPRSVRFTCPFCDFEFCSVYIEDCWIFNCNCKARLVYMPSGPDHVCDGCDNRLDCLGRCNVDIRRVHGGHVRHY